MKPFRVSTYVAPPGSIGCQGSCNVIAHLHLGLALEASGDVSAACRAYAAARNALDRSDAAMVEETLEGYGVDELARLLDMKLEGSR